MSSTRINVAPSLEPIPEYSPQKPAFSGIIFKSKKRVTTIDWLQEQEFTRVYQPYAPKEFNYDGIQGDVSKKITKIVYFRYGNCNLLQIKPASEFYSDLKNKFDTCQFCVPASFIHTTPLQSDSIYLFIDSTSQIINVVNVLKQFDKSFGSIRKEIIDSMSPRFKEGYRGFINWQSCKWFDVHSLECYKSYFIDAVVNTIQLYPIDDNSIELVATIKASEHLKIITELKKENECCKITNTIIFKLSNLSDFNDALKALISCDSKVDDKALIMSIRSSCNLKYQQQPKDSSVNKSPQPIVAPPKPAVAWADEEKKHPDKSTTATTVRLTDSGSNALFGSAKPKGSASQQLYEYPSHINNNKPMTCVIL